MTAFNAALADLYARGHLIKCTPNQLQTMFHYRFTHVGRLTDEEIDVVPALSEAALRTIVRGAINGNIPDITSISMMYAAGFGLPRDIDKAAAWSAFAVLQSANVTFVEAVNALKRDALNSIASKREELIWPEAFETAIDQVLDKLERVRDYDGEAKMAGGAVFPRISGIRVYLFYRVYDNEHGGKSAHLYGALTRTRGKVRYCLDELRLLDIPIELGMLRNRQTLHNYAPFDSNAKLYVISGVLASPLSKRKAMREHFPEVKTVTDLFEHYLASLSRRRLKDFDFVITELRAEISKLQKRLAVLEQKPKKNAAKIKTVKKSIAKRETRIADSVNETRKAKEEYDQRQPETYLHFVANGIYHYQNGKLTGAKLRGGETCTHLKSLGFKSFTNPVIPVVGYVVSKSLSKTDLDNIIDKFSLAYKGEYSITGLTLRPKVESVNIRHCYQYSKSATGE